jgi:hypothetical protein
MGCIDMTIELLWFDDCPNHRKTRQLLEEVLAQRHIEERIVDVNLTDPEVAKQYRFPGSPTIRVDGRDIEPDFADAGDYTPRCRLYLTARGLVGVPDRRWIETALEQR